MFAGQLVLPVSATAGKSTRTLLALPEENNAARAWLDRTRSNVAAPTRSYKLLLIAARSRLALEQYVH